MDRTVDFMSLVHKSAKKANPAPRSSSVVQRRSEFMLRAKKLSGDTFKVFAKLERLTTLAKKKSIFDNRDSEIGELSTAITDEISQLNKEIAALQDMGKSLSGDSRQKQSKSIVVTLQSKLASISTSFKSVMKKRTETMQKEKERRDLFQDGPETLSMPRGAVEGHRLGCVMFHDDMSIPGDDQQAPLLNQQKQTQFQIQMPDETEDYVNSRASAMENIEASIVAIGGIFKQLATLVHEQNEVIERIDAHVEETVINVEDAHMEIVKHSQSINSNRWLMIKIFGVLIVFFIIFVVFLA